MNDTSIRAERLSKRYTSQRRQRRWADWIGTSVKRLGDGCIATFGTAEAQPESFWALLDVSFEIKRGEVVGIIGRNGSGKSTLLKLLSRITEPTSGRADIYGRVGSLLEVGTGFHPDLTGRENVFLSGALLGMSRADIKLRFDEIVAFAELGKFIDMPVKYYSSGMYVRLAFSVAAHLEPDILIVDEVLGVGDSAFQQKSLDKMHDLVVDGNRTVIIVSHSLATLSSLCDNAIYLHQGCNIGAGPACDVLRAYQHDCNLVEREQKMLWQGTAGDNDITLLRTWARSLGDEEAISAESIIEIGAELDLSHPIAHLIFGIRIFSEFGDPIIYSLYDDNSLHTDECIPAGRLMHRWRIPARTLAAGRYRIDFAIGIHGTKKVVQDGDGTLSITVEPSPQFANKFAVGHRRGFSSLLRPDWHVAHDQ